MISYTINGNSLQHAIPNVESQERSQGIDFARFVPQNQERAIRCSERLISVLHNVDNTLEELFPNHTLQIALDTLGRYIENLFEPLTPFTDWMKKSDYSSWPQLFATSLVRLPLRSAYSIVQPLYTGIKGVCYGASHPLKATSDLAKLVITLVDQLTKAEMWSRMGCALIGTSMGQSLVTRNLVSLIGAAIGAAMVLGGVSMGALQAALAADLGKRRQAACDYLSGQALELTEALLTSFYTGLILGGVQKAIERYQKIYRVSLYADKREFANDFIYYKNLPQYDSLSDDFFYRFEWTSPEHIAKLKERLPEIFASIPASKLANRVSLLLPNDYLMDSDSWIGFQVWYPDKKIRNLCHFTPGVGPSCGNVGIPGMEDTSVIFKGDNLTVMWHHSF